MNIMTLGRQPWMKDRKCSGSVQHLFFPAKGVSAQQAKMICAECPVFQQCARFALEDHGLIGVWGGMTEGERDRIRLRAPHVARGETSESTDLAGAGSFPDTWMELLPDREIGERQLFPAPSSNWAFRTAQPSPAERMAADAEQALQKRRQFFDELFAEEVDEVMA